MIWDLMLEERRVVQVDMRPRSRPSMVVDGNENVELPGEAEWFSRTPIPALLHACSESRMAASRRGRYELVFGGKHGDAVPKIYFNFALDTLHFHSDPIRESGRPPDQFHRSIDAFERHIPIDQIQRIRSVAMEFHPSNARIAIDHLQSKATSGMWLALRVVALDIELCAALEFRVGIEFVDISDEYRRTGKESQIYGRVFTRDPPGLRIVGKIQAPTGRYLAAYGNLKMLLLSNEEMGSADLVSHVLDCGFEDLRAVG